MPYAIQTVDKPDSSALRAKVREEHLKYLDANVHRLLAAGAVIDDDGSGGHGGILTRWRKAYFNKQRFI